MTDNDDHPVYRGDFLGGTCDCNASYNPDAEMPVFYKTSRPIARKNHICCECGQTILPGTSYLCIRGKWEGNFETYKLCPVCTEIQNTFFFYGHALGEMYNDLQNYVEYIDGQIPEDCLCDLSDPARSRVLEIIDQFFDISQ